MHAVRGAGGHHHHHDGGGRGGHGGHGGGPGGPGQGVSGFGAGGVVVKRAEKGTVYRIGKQKFTLDGKDGKTLDDIIEVGTDAGLRD